MPILLSKLPLARSPSLLVAHATAFQPNLILPLPLLAGKRFATSSFYPCFIRVDPWLIPPAFFVPFVSFVVHFLRSGKALLCYDE